jgi:uncharacterized membrane protein YkvA (DUF1232 family)
MTSNSDMMKAQSKFLPKMKKVLRLVPFARDAVAMYFTMLDPHVPLWAKGTIAGALVYFVVPTDVIPDVIPIAGYADDAGVIYAALKTVHMFVDEYQYAKADGWLNGK